MFHSARAILFRDGIKERGHECIPVYLREKYPQLETLANILDSYRRFRHDAIYGLDFAIDDREAKVALDSAKEFLEVLSDLGYKIIYGPDIAPDGISPERHSYSDVILIERLIDAIGRFNPDVSEEAREEVVKKVLRSESPLY